VIDQAVEILRRGGLVAFPTETVYGLGADADNPLAVAKIFAAKGRPAGRPLTLHIGPSGAPQFWAHWTPDARALAERFWPGPLTLVVRRKAGRIDDIVTGGLDTVGIRMPNHPMAISLLDAFGGGLAAPSANRSGHLSPTSAAHVRQDLGDRVDLILDGGPCTVGIESTVLSLVDTPTILRLGGVSRAALEEVLGPIYVKAQTEPHYQPTTPVSIEEPPSLGSFGVIAFSLAPRGFTGTWIAASPDPGWYAQHLYTMLRELDAAGHSRIIVAPVPDDPAWEVIAARLAAVANNG
jgi:L-threonylcarbamoyladenylate synthase